MATSQTERPLPKNAMPTPGRTRKRGATGRQRDPDERFLGERSCRCAAPWLPGRDRAGPGLVEPDVSNHAKGERATAPRGACKPVRFGLLANSSSCVAPPILARFCAASCRTKVLELVAPVHSRLIADGSRNWRIRGRPGARGPRPAFVLPRVRPAAPTSLTAAA